MIFKEDEKMAVGFNSSISDVNPYKAGTRHRMSSVRIRVSRQVMKQV